MSPCKNQFEPDLLLIPVDHEVLGPDLPADLVLLDKFFELFRSLSDKPVRRCEYFVVLISNVSSGIHREILACFDFHEFPKGLMLHFTTPLPKEVNAGINQQLQDKRCGKPTDHGSDDTFHH